MNTTEVEPEAFRLRTPALENVAKLRAAAEKRVDKLIRSLEDYRAGKAILIGRRDHNGPKTIEHRSIEDQEED